jgi:hypothetical protein
MEVVTLEQLEAIAHPSTLEDIILIVHSLASNKAPKLDGITIEVITTC